MTMEWPRFRFSIATVMLTVLAVAVIVTLHINRMVGLYPLLPLVIAARLVIAFEARLRSRSMGRGWTASDDEAVGRAFRTFDFGFLIVMAVVVLAMLWLR